MPKPPNCFELFGRFYLRISNRLPVRGRKRIKIFKVFGHPVKTPIPNRGKAQPIRNLGVMALTRFGKSNSPQNRTGNRNAGKPFRLKNHTIDEGTNLCINIKTLRVHHKSDLIMTLEFEEITKTSVKGLEVPIIKGNPTLVKRQKTILLRNKVFKSGSIDNPDARQKAIRHVSIDSPTFFLIPLKLMDKQARLA